LQAAYVAPRTEVERMLAGIWQEVLGVGQVGADDNFFDLGGHSLRLLQVQHRLREVLGQELNAVEMFRYPTVGAMAAYLSGGRAPAELNGQHDEARKRSETRLRLRGQRRPRARRGAQDG
jgi:aryl carrier-like protein